jgi:alditol oxidase
MADRGQLRLTPCNIALAGLHRGSEGRTMSDVLTNWAGNVTFGARELNRPATVGELQLIVAGSGRIRAIGTGHSFSRIADSPGELVSLAGLPADIEIAADGASVRVGAGTTYAELARQLHARGYALANLGSLPHISVAGACATGTHGSGSRIGNLATAVRALEMVTAGGDLVTLSRDDQDFAGAVVALGSLGVVVSLTLDLVPDFDVRQYVYLEVPRERVDDELDGIFAAAYSVSLFTDWRAPRINQIWLKQLVTDPADAGLATEIGGTLARTDQHPVPGMSAASATPQLGVPGPWHERLPHFRPEFTPSAGRELQTEFLLPRQHAAAALRAIDEVSDAVAAVVQISELRTVAADDLWLSPSYRRDTAAFHFTWIDDVNAVEGVIRLVDERLAPFQARPHWGKLFATEPAVVQGLYERLPDFQRLVRSYDPREKFRNDFTSSYLGLR